MSQGFKIKLNEIKEGDPTKSEGELMKDNSDYYPESAYVRFVNFVLPSGNESAHYYVDLLSCDYLIEDGSLLMTFRSGKIELKGVRLKKLRMDLLKHLPKEITCVNERYNATMDDNNPIVNHIALLNGE